MPELELWRGNRVVPPIDGEATAIDVPNRDNRVLGKVMVRGIEGDFQGEFVA